MTYRVKWEIDIDANTAKEAAKKAFECICKEGTMDNCFDVSNNLGEVTRVDLLEEYMGELGT